MIQNEIGVVDSAHRKKLELRAMDVVLFGPPRGLHTCIFVFLYLWMYLYFCISG